MSSLAGDVNFQIFSRVVGLQNLTIGINHSNTTWQAVSVDEPVNTWIPSRVGNNLYGFGIGGYGYTGGTPGGNIVVSIFAEVDVKWLISYEEAQDAYTISPNYDRTLGWTIGDAYSENPTVELQPLGSPYSPEEQVFQIVPV